MIPHCNVVVMMDLGTLLISNGICTPLQIEEALRNQIIFGGQLGTVLFELEYLDEASLADYLSKKYNTPALYGSDIECLPGVLELMPGESANRLEVIPYRLKGRQLEILCMDPSNLHRLDEVSFVTGMRVKPIVVTEFRFWYLLRQHYGIRHQLRYIDLASKDPSQATHAAGTETKPLVTTTEEGELISELDFTRYYHQVDNYHELKIPPEMEAELELNQPVDDLTREIDISIQGASGKPDLLFLDEQYIQELKPEPAQAQSTPPDQQPAPSPRPPESQPPHSESAAPSTEPPGSEAAAEPLEIDLDSFETDAPILSFSEAQQQLHEAVDRDAIAKIITRFGLSVFTRVMMFTVRHQMVLGWIGMGEAIPAGQVRSLRIPLSGPSVFQMVVRTRAHYVGSLQKTPINIQFLRDTGKVVPLSAFVLPILLRGQVVNLLYGDNGHKKHCNHNIGELLILAQRISQSFEELIQKKLTNYLKTTQ